MKRLIFILIAFVSLACSQVELGTIGLKAGSVDSTTIADNSVTSKKILDGTLLNQDYADESVDSDAIEDDTIASTDIKDATIVTEDISTGGVETGNILDGTILAGDIATNAVEAAEIKAEAVGSSEILDYGIQTADIDTNAVTGGIAGGIAYKTVTGWNIGDATIDSTKIASNTITSTRILDGTILNQDLATGAVTTSEILDETITSADIKNDEVTQAEIANNAVASGEIIDYSIQTSDIDTGAVATLNLASSLTITNLTVDNLIEIGKSATFTGSAICDANPATRKAVSVPGAGSSDFYFLTVFNPGTPLSTDVVAYEAKADSLIIHHMATSTSELVVIWMRVAN